MPAHPTPEPDVPDVPTAELPDPEPGTEPEDEAPEDGVHLNRRERRAKQNGAPSAVVHGPRGGRHTAAPAGGRDYARRRRG
jgi:hypothetical protein